MTKLDAPNTDALGRTLAAAGHARFVAGLHAVLPRAEAEAKA